MKQTIASRIQTTISIIQGDQRVIIETNNDSPSLIQVNTNGIHIRIQTGRMIAQPTTPTYDSFEVVKPIALPGPIAPPPVMPNPEFIKPGFNSWPFQKSLTYVSDLPIQTTEFVRLALKWCEENIEKTKRRYTYELKYFKPKKTMGTYGYASRKITVYVYPSLALKSLCETLIHEYAHHLFIKTIEPTPDNLIGHKGERYISTSVLTCHYPYLKPGKLTTAWACIARRRSTSS
jgi:hypothetical protein